MFDEKLEKIKSDGTGYRAREFSIKNYQFSIEAKTIENKKTEVKE